MKNIINLVLSQFGVKSAVYVHCLDLSGRSGGFPLVFRAAITQGTALG